jgi:hypothetical protein
VCDADGVHTTQHLVERADGSRGWSGSLPDRCAHLPECNGRTRKGRPRRS